MNLFPRSITIDQFKKKKRELEEELQTIVQERISKLLYETGFSPYSIDIKMVECTMIGEEPRRWLVDDIKVNIEI